jgi:hypothetical protein
MSAERSNSVVVLHTHKDLTDSLNIKALLQELLEANDTRQSIFGTASVEVLNA